MLMLIRGIRGGAGGSARPAAYVAAAALVVTAMAVAMWAGPLAGAGARAQSHGASPPPAPVKFYIVPPPGDGRADSLFAIAATTVGDGRRFMEIFNLNKGRLQPNGGRLTSPQTIKAGWILRLPEEATGPGVHVGPLPTVTPAASHRPPRPAAGVAASSHLPFLLGGAASAILFGGALLCFLVAGLTFGLSRRRATLRRVSMHVGAPGPPAADRYLAAPSAPAPPGAPWDPTAWDDDDEWGPLAPTVPGAQQWAADLATAPGPPPQASQDTDQAEVVPTEPLAYDAEGAAGPGTGAQGVPRVPGDQGTAPADASWAEESVRLANWILSDAEHQAAEIRQQAACQAGHTREAAERDAAELRATLMEMSAELARVTAHVTGILQGTDMPATARAARPDESPAPRPAARSAPRPATPATMPGRPPARPAKPAARPAARSRQFRAARLPVLAMGVAILFGLIAATTEMALHGYDFFVFRSPGTGATQDGPPGPAPSQAGTGGAHHRLQPDGAQATSAEGR